MDIRLLNTEVGLRNSTTRLPFRYGKACLTRCPQLIFKATIEVEGKRQAGYSGDCLPPGWFDKSPGKPFSQQIDDMLSVIATADQAFREQLAQTGSFFRAWRSVDRSVHATAVDQGLPSLLAGFGVAIVERAILDAMARHAGLSFFQATKQNLFGIEPGEIHASLEGLQVADWLPERPTSSIFVRHTVGLVDPLTAAEIPVDERLDDGQPQALEEYIQACGIRYFKIKVANRLDHDIERLKTIAGLAEQRWGSDYSVTLDGNELYTRADEFDTLVERLRTDPELETLVANTLVIEQPLERSIALDPKHTQGIRELGHWKPVIIDESDGEITSYPEALELGYRGVSSKNCKGPIRSFLNAGLTWLRNERGARSDYWMTGEDLCSVGIVPVQADLCLVATLGLTHVERNGHHYHPGLSYLPRSQAEAALQAHGDLYTEHNGVIVPNVVDGKFSIGSLQCTGFGFAVEPEMETMQTPKDWQFDSLGLDES